MVECHWRLARQCAIESNENMSAYKADMSPDGVDHTKLHNA